jgi:hypothetical protein
VADLSQRLKAATRDLAVTVGPSSCALVGAVGFERRESATVQVMSDSAQLARMQFQYWMRLYESAVLPLAMLFLLPIHSFDALHTLVALNLDFT